MKPMHSNINLIIENISETNLSKLTEMVIKLWTDCNYEEEFENCLKIIKSANQNIFIAKANDEYIGFIQLSLRADYVEGTTSSPVVYTEIASDAELNNTNSIEFHKSIGFKEVNSVVCFTKTINVSH